MFNLGNEVIDIYCSCGIKHAVTLQDTANGKMITCLCGNNIQLEDYDGSLKKGVTDINKAFDDFEKMFKELGR